MTKALIAAIFLSQAPIQDIRVFHEQPTIVDYINYELHLHHKLVNTRHIRSIIDGAVVVSEDRWYTPKAPIDYTLFWNCPFPRQTAQQCVAIESVLQQEFNYLYRSPLQQEIDALRKRIEEKTRRRLAPPF